MNVFQCLCFSLFSIYRDNNCAVLTTTLHCIRGKSRKKNYNLKSVIILKQMTQTNVSTLLHLLLHIFKHICFFLISDQKITEFV